MSYFFLHKPATLIQQTVFLIKVCNYNLSSDITVFDVAKNAMQPQLRPHQLQLTVTLYYIRDHDETTIIIRGHYLKPRQQIYLPTGIILQLITKSSMNKLRRRKKGKNKNYPVLLNTSIAGANAPTPGKTKRLAFKMSSGV